ncbi:aminopeptidase Ey-like [Formica exsecta]|uniref:aminopeptidase Ey-like n=1 Tax=Formica exsecta TaxID=72781 RepID=UPI00114116A7|nr:aminopeptidase Ey-like [Formica exsecta]
MIFLKLLLSSGLFFAAAAPLTNKQSFTLLDYIKPEHYNIKLIPYVIPYDQDTFYGECNVSINILQPTHTINLHSDAQCIQNIELIDNPPRFQQSDDTKMVIYKPIKYLRDSKTQIAEFSFKNEIASGRYTLNMKFTGVIADNGGFRTFSLMDSKFVRVMADNVETFVLMESEYNNRGWMAATHYQIDGVRRLFPCWDKPELKATFDISIIHPLWDKPELKATFDISIIHPRNYTAFSNMPTREIKVLKNDMASIHYDTTVAMSTSFIAAVIVNRAELFIRNVVGTVANMYNRKIASYLLFHTENIVEKITSHLKKEWGRSQKISKVDHVVIQHFDDENMITLGLVLYREFDIVYKETSDPVGRKIKVLRLVVSKILREWFSFRWSHSWLTEAFITFFGAYVVDKTISDSRIMDLFMVQIQQDCLHLDAEYSMWPLSSQINSSFEIPYYIRASVILHMLQHTVGKEAFWKGIRTYIYDNYCTISDSRIMDLFMVQIQQDCLHLDAEYSMWPLSSQINSSFEIPYYIRASVILHMLQHTVGKEAFWKGIRTYIYDNTYKWGASNDFWTAMQTGFDKIPYFPFEGFNITKQMDPWIKQRHYPVLKVIRNPGGFKNITLEILNTSNNWSIPLTYTTQANINFEDTLPEIWLNMSDIGRRVYILDIATSSFDKELNESEWIIFNVKQTGYYRINYDAKNWQLISDYLDSPHFMNIHVLNRAQLIDDAFHLMIARQLDSSIFWNLTRYLHQEEDYVAWYPMFKALEQMSSVFQLQDPEVDAIKENMNKILNTLLQKLEYDEVVEYSGPIKKYEKDFRKSLRQEAAKWACLLGEINCRNKASEILKENWLFPNHIMIWWREWTYCNGLAVSNSTWSNIYKTWERTYDNRLFKLLACAEPNTIKTYLTLITSAITFQQFSNSKTLELLTKGFIDSFPFIIAKNIKNKVMLSYILYHVLYFGEASVMPSKLNMIATLTIIINHVYSKLGLNVERKVWENVAQHVSKIYKKIQKRKSEIESQKKYLQSFKLTK